MYIYTSMNTKLRERSRHTYCSARIGVEAVKCGIPNQLHSPTYAVGIEANTFDVNFLVLWNGQRFPRLACCASVLPHSLEQVFVCFHRSRGLRVPSV